MRISSLRRIDQAVALCWMFSIAMFAVFIGLMVQGRWATDSPIVIDDTHVQRRHDADRLLQVERLANRADWACGYARSEAALSNAKADWLRAHLSVLYRRMGMGSVAKGLAQWPGGETRAMEGVR